MQSIRPHIRRHLSAARPYRLVALLSVTGGLSLVAIAELADDIGSTELSAVLYTRVGQFVLEHRDPWVLTTAYTMTLLAQVPVVIAVSIVLAALLWRHRARVFLVGMSLALAASYAASTIGKLAIQRPRPNPPLQVIVESSFAFPSGHTTIAVVLYGYLAYLIVRTQQRRRTKIIAVALAFVALIAVGTSRILLGVHYLSDVLAGTLVGGCGLMLGIGITEWLIRTHSLSPHLRLRSLIPVWIVLAAAIGTMLLTSDVPGT